MSAPALQLTVVVAYLLALAAHEGAHAIAGRLAGFPLYRIAIGPLNFMRQANGSWRFVQRPFNDWLSGKTCAHPAANDGASQARLARVIAAGPATSLALGLVAAGASLVAGWHSPVAQAALVFGVSNLVIAIAVLLPFRWQFGTLSDGGALLQFATAPAKAGRFAALAVLAERQHRGIRPRDWEPQLLADAASVPDDSPEAILANRQTYDHALDAGSLDAANTALQQVLSRLPILRGRQGRRIQHDVRLEAAYLAAARDGDGTRARTYLDQESTCSPLCVRRARAEAAMSVAEGDLRAARERITPVLAQVSTPYQREWLERSAQPNGGW